MILPSWAVLSLWFVSAAPASRHPTWEDVPGISPPLGALADVVTMVPPGGFPPQERAEIVKFPGCAKPQVLWLSRYALNAALAAQKIQDWLQSTSPWPSKVLLQPRVLSDAVEAIRLSAEQKRDTCQPVRREGWMLDALTEAPPPCSPGASAPHEGIAWFAVPGKRLASAVVSYGPPAPDSKDPCRPRMSAVLFDKKGHARIRYHTDFQDLVTADLVGDRCQGLRFVLDTAKKTFRPTLEKRGHGCKATPAR